MPEVEENVKQTSRGEESAIHLSQLIVSQLRFGNHQLTTVRK
jgi:hypothetical protein